MAALGSGDVSKAGKQGCMDVDRAGSGGEKGLARFGDHGLLYLYSDIAPLLCRVAKGQSKEFTGALRRIAASQAGSQACGEGIVGVDLVQISAQVRCGCGPGT